MSSRTSCCYQEKEWLINATPVFGKKKVKDKKYPCYIIHICDLFIIYIKTVPFQKQEKYFQMESEEFFFFFWNSSNPSTKLSITLFFFNEIKPDNRTEQCAVSLCFQYEKYLHIKRSEGIVIRMDSQILSRIHIEIL